MRNYNTRRTLLALSPVIAAIGFAVAMAPGAAQPTTTYAIVTSSYGNIVGALQGSGVSAATAGLSLNATLVLKAPPTGTTFTPPKGTKFTPLYVVITSAGISNSWVGLQPTLKCPVGHLPALNLQMGGPKSMAPTSKNWQCMSISLATLGM